MILLVLAAGAFDVPDTLLDSALADAGGNRPELEMALSGAGEHVDQVRWLIASMPHLDRLEMKGKTLLDHVELANAAREEMPDTIFRDYLLSYRIWDEPCDDWRPALADSFGGFRSPGALKKWIAGNVALDTTSYFFGPFPSPLSTLLSRGGSRLSRCVLLVAGLRSQGVPARLARCPSPPRTWVEYWQDGKWLPLYFEKPEVRSIVLVQEGFDWAQATDRYCRTGELALCFTRDGLVDSTFEGFCVQRWNGWSWDALDDLAWPLEGEEEAGDSSGTYCFHLASGDYLVVWGERNASGEPFVRTEPVKVKAGKTISLSLRLGIPPEVIAPRDLMARPLDSFPNIELMDSTWLLDRLQYPCVVAFLGDDEASHRTTGQLSDMGGLRVFSLRVDVDVARETLEKSLGVSSLPSVILLDAEATPILWTEGFNQGLPLYIKSLVK